ncbi:hypothetical protein [Rothia uropygialis]|uniref:hypothetical protein n=1 Tax=Kocuria sp. 36 TaxID=1415402 RepID=UPI00101D9CCA|nr:hypothetical protein [Kocuria sp. 36]
MRTTCIKTISSISAGSILALGIFTPSQAFRIEDNADNGDSVFSLNQTDQKAIIGGGAAVVGTIVTGGAAAIAAGVLAPYITDVGLCPGDQARYISYKATNNTAGSTITNSWCK